MNWITGTYPIKRDLHHYRGDSVAQADFTFEHPYGASSNIDEAIFTVRDSEDGTAIYTLTLSTVASQWDFTTSGTGKLQILDSDTDGLAAKSRVTHSDDGEYVYDIELQHTDGRTVTVLYGRYTLWADVSHAGGGGGLETNTDRQLIAWALQEAWAGTFTRDSDGVVTSASITWPDGGTGTLTTTKNTTWLCWDAFTATYSKGAISKTVTQAAVTRNSNGEITTRPIPTVA